MLKFFELGENNNLRLVKEELLLHPEFAIVYRKSPKMEGDSEGKNKVYARMFFTYLYLMYDYQSPFASEIDDKRHELVVKEAGFPKDWKPNKMEKDAIDKYLFLQDLSSPTLKIIASIKKGLTASAAIVNQQTKRMYKNLETLEQLSENLDYTKADDVASYNTLNDMLQKNLTSFLPLAENLDKNITYVQNLEEKVKKELSTGIASAAGGRSIGNRADPK